jgi:hypothetical protein
MKPACSRWLATKKVEVIRSSETSVNIRTTQSSVSEDGNILKLSIQENADRNIRTSICILRAMLCCSVGFRSNSEVCPRCSCFPQPFICHGENSYAALAWFTMSSPTERLRFAKYKNMYTFGSNTFVETSWKQEIFIIYYSHRYPHVVHTRPSSLSDKWYCSQNELQTGIKALNWLVIRNNYIKKLTYTLLFNSRLVTAVCSSCKSQDITTILRDN